MSASANDNSSRSAQEVGWIFVREYCNHLREKPESLFQFYDKQASLIYGLEGEEVKICQGQQEIKKNITEMQLKDALIKIINVDSLDFLDGKVVIQVIGEISNKGEAYKKFVRTVILVKHMDDNDNYYVLSDIFRYLKDENVNVIKQQSIDQEPSYIEDGLSTLNEEKSANEDTVSSTGTLNEESAQESSRELKVIEDSVPDIPPTKTETPSLAKSPTEDSINQVVDENSTESEKSNLSDVRSKVQPSPINVQTEKLATTSSNATNQITSPTESRSPSKPNTWANLAASDSQKWSNSQLAESKGRVVQPPLARTQSQQSNREHRDQRDQNQRDQRDQNTRGGGSTVNNKEFSLYVKGIVEGMNRSVLEKAFSKFGAVRNVDVVIAKSCAFVEFANQEAYQQALNQKEIDVPNYTPVFVEERKPKDGHERRRYDNNYHRNYNSHSGINSQRSSRGGRNMTNRPPAKS